MSFNPRTTPINKMYQCTVIIRRSGSSVVSKREGSKALEAFKNFLQEPSTSSTTKVAKLETLMDNLNLVPYKPSPPALFDHGYCRRPEPEEEDSDEDVSMD